MKRLTSILIFLLLTVLLLVSCKNSQTSNSQTSQKQGESQPEQTTTVAERPVPMPADGVLSCTRTNDTVKVTVNLSSDANKEISLIALTDPDYQYTWMDNASACLSDIAQTALDENGKAELTLKLTNETDTFYLILTAPSGSYIAEVK